MKFPFYSFDKDKIDLSLLRRFLYQNDIKHYHLYTQEAIEEQTKERSNLSDKQKKFLATTSPPKSRWQILDL